MKTKISPISVAALGLSLAGLLLLNAPASRAQAQENIADVPANTQTNGDTGQISPTGQEPVQQGPDMQGPAAQYPGAQGPSMDGMNADGPAPDDKTDPPSRAGRLSYIDGSVSLQPGGTGDWGTAVKNRPLTIGDKIWSDNESRAEIQAGQAALHLGSMTAISFLNLDQNVTQVRLAEGKLNFRVRELREGENYEVDTPNLSFTVKQAGDFRIDVNENGDYTSVTVVRGAGDISAAGQTYSVTAGQRADVSGTNNNVKYIPGTASEPDALDRWAQERDLKEDNSTSARYVSRDTVGYSDLDDNGTWSEQPEAGNVWTPNNVPPDWAPYSDGSWNYVAPWGWSWVDYSPWGFAPFHYGRWGIYGGRWGWCPGPIYARPYYGPAFVGFLGGGGFGFGIGFGFGFGYGHGWFPLGWGEAYHPWYHAGANYWHNVNVHNTYIRNTNSITAHNNNYRYASNTRAVTTASHNSFVNGERINRSSQHLTEASLRGSHVTNGVNASPTHNSYMGAAHSTGRVATPSASVQNRSVMTHTAPAASASHEQARTFSSAGANSGRSTAVGTANTSRPNTTSSGFNNNSRQSELSSNRPPATRTQTSGAGTSGRGWSAQGNTTDSGRAPQGFGASNRSTNTTQSARINSANRPPNAGSYSANSAYGRNTYNGAVSRNTASRPPSSMGGNRAYNSQTYGGNRSYNPQSYSGNRSYGSQPNYGTNYGTNHGNRSAPAYRGNSGYSAPHNYSAPHSSGGGGGSYHGGGGSGGGSSHSSGGGSHGGGGGGSHGGGGGGHH
jgi:hypothetical protein